MARHFCLKHKLPAPVETVLAETIQEQLDKLPRASAEARPSATSLTSYQAQWKAFFAAFNTTQQASRTASQTTRKKPDAQTRHREMCPFRPDTQLTQRANQKLLQQAAIRQSDQPGLQPSLQPVRASHSPHQRRAHKLSQAMISKKLEALFARLNGGSPVTRSALESPGVPSLLQSLCGPALQDSQVLTYETFARILQKELEGPDLCGGTRC